MAILDSEDKQAIRELAFGATEKIKDKVWRAILLIGLVVIQISGIITLVRLHNNIIDPWLLGGIFGCGIGLVVLILSLNIFKNYHQLLRKLLFPITLLCCFYLAFAMLAPVYRHGQAQHSEAERHYSFVGSPSLWWSRLCYNERV